MKALENPLFATSDSLNAASDKDMYSPAMYLYTPGVIDILFIPPILFNLDFVSLSI